MSNEKCLNFEAIFSTVKVKLLIDFLSWKNLQLEFIEKDLIDLILSSNFDYSNDYEISEYVYIPHFRLTLKLHVDFILCKVKSP